MGDDFDIPSLDVMAGKINDILSLSRKCISASSKFRDLNHVTGTDHYVSIHSKTPSRYFTYRDRGLPDDLLKGLNKGINFICLDKAAIFVDGEKYDVTDNVLDDYFALSTVHDLDTIKYMYICSKLNLNEETLSIGAETFTELDYILESLREYSGL